MATFPRQTVVFEREDIHVACERHRKDVRKTWGPMATVSQTLLNLYR